MKIRLLATLLLICGLGSTLWGQDLAGTWQGTLNAPNAQLRFVFKIATTADGKFTGQGFSIDQNGQPLPMNAITAQGRTVKWKVDAAGASFEGTFSADGNAITGTMTLGPGPMPLNLVRATPQSAWAIPEPPAPPKPMDPKADPNIEVATVKLSAAPAGGRLYTMRGTQLMALNVTVLNVLTFAYDLHEKQISGGPPWMSSDRFEIVIKPDTPGQPNIQQMKRCCKRLWSTVFRSSFTTRNANSQSTRSRCRRTRSTR